MRGESDPPAQLDISITSGDRSLPIGPAENSLDYSFSGFSGTEVATVDVDEAGSYSMVVETRREGEFAIALGKDVVSTVLPWVLGAMALAAVGLILGLIILIVTGVKRAAASARQPWPRRHRLSVRSRCLHAGAAPPTTPPAPPVAPVPVPVPADVPPEQREPVPVGGGLSTGDDSAFAPPADIDPGRHRQPAPSRHRQARRWLRPAARSTAEPGRGRGRPGRATARAGPHHPAGAADGQQLPPPPPPSQGSARAGRTACPPLPSPPEPSSGASLPPPSSATAALLTLRGRRCPDFGTARVIDSQSCYGFVSVG